MQGAEYQLRKEEAEGPAEALVFLKKFSLQVLIPKGTSKNILGYETATERQWRTKQASRNFTQPNEIGFVSRQLLEARCPYGAIRLRHEYNVNDYK
jgi:hypothetical protein